MPSILSIADFGALPGGADCTAALVRAASACSGRRDTTLVFPPGRYAISPGRASESWAGISNHEPSVARRIALEIVGAHGLTLQGHGAILEARGHVIPIAIVGGSDITIEGLGIDWAIPLHAWAECVGSWNGWMDLRLSGGHPARIVRERLHCVVDGQLEEIWGTYAMDPAAGMVPAERSGDNCGSAFTIPYVAEQLDADVVRLRCHVVTPPLPGQVVILRHGKRIAPALLASKVEGITVRDVEIRQAGGMALIMQHCRDPLVQRVRVVAGPLRPFSANHDATHFVSCRGTVRLQDCVLERQLDDGTNVHGINLPIHERLGDRGLVVRLAHIEQRGCIPVEAGERFGVVDQRTLRLLDEFRVAAVRVVNQEFIELTAEGPLPGSASCGSALESLDAAAGAVVTGCTIGHNRARGLLFSTRGVVRIENNRFLSPGPAILLHGDGRSWHESGAVPETVIRGNHFERCGYAREPRWGAGVILVEPEIPAESGPYHGAVVVEDNVFTGCLLPPIKARAAAALVVRGNHGVAGPDGILMDGCGPLEFTGV